MTKEFDVEIDEDPELGEDETHGSEGGDEHYDNLAVESIPFDESQFELPEDLEVSDDD